MSDSTRSDSSEGVAARGRRVAPAPGLAVAIALVMNAVLTLAQATDNEWFVGRPIEDFEFAGLTVVKSQDLRPIVRVYLGKPFSWELFWEAQARLYELDYFEDIRAEAREGSTGPSGVVILLTVRERLSVSKIAVDGNKRVSRAAIVEKVRVKVGDFASSSDLKIDAAAIEGLYEEKGFPDAAVEVDQAADPGGGRTVDVTFRIREGQRVGIREILFAGNEQVSAESLRSRMKTRSRSLFNSGVLRADLLREDTASIVAWYRGQGYVDAKVTHVDQSTVPDQAGQGEAGTDLIITIYVDEGRRYSYGGVTWSGNHVFSDDQIGALMRLSPGTVLDAPAAEAQLRRLSDLYADEGYIYTSITTRQVRDEQAGTIAYEVTISERDKARIASIVLKGNQKTKDHVIMRELPFSEGEVFSSSKIRQGYLNLSNLQYFAAIDIEPEEGSLEGLVDLIVTVEEQSWATFTFGLSFSGGDFPVSGQLGWSDTNVGGTGRSAGANVEASSSKQGLSLSFSDAYLFSPSWGGGASVSFYRRNIDDVPQDIEAPLFWDDDVPDPYDDPAEYDDDVDDGDVDIPDSSTMEYDSIDISIGLSTSYLYPTHTGRLTVKTSLSSTFTYVTYDDSIYRPYSSLVRENLGTWLPINSLTATLSWDTRDIYSNPTRGYLVSESVQYTGGLLAGSRDYIKPTSRADGFLTLLDVPLKGDHSFTAVLAAHTSLSFLLSQLGGDLNVATSDTLTVDGSTIGRGWDYQADYFALWDSVLELRGPIARRFLWWTWFIEGTGAWSEAGGLWNLSEDDFYLSWGGGLRLTIPGMPVRMYLAQPFRVLDGKVVLEDGGISLGSLNLAFVLAISLPGDF